MANIGLLTSADAVKLAIAECDKTGRTQFLKQYGFRSSRGYPLVFNGRMYDSKAIAAVAFGYQHGTVLKHEEFSGGEKGVAPVLTTLGFSVGPATGPAEWLVKGRTYFRKELSERFGGQLQSGIWTPKDFPAVFLFTGDSGGAYGYKDAWTAEGVFQYTGEGQQGDMAFQRGNAAIRDHRQNGKDLFLFRDLGKGKGVRYEGMYECIGWDKGHEAPDRNGRTRKTIVFDLVPVSSAAILRDSGNLPRSGKSLSDLRAAAYSAFEGSTAGHTARGESTARIWYERSEHVRAYVLARAAGRCECCKRPAPFYTRHSEPYLEPHHITRLADDGLDHPAHVAAVCPNCHRHIHSGLDGEEVNARLAKSVREGERVILAKPRADRRSA